jgi:cysteine synthase A
MDIITEKIGNTPLLLLERASKEAGQAIYGKAEYVNPAGSIKDRTCHSMLTQALARGDLRPGDTVVEATAGNTGLGLLHFAQQLNLKVVIFMYQGESQHKISRLRSLGARVFEVPFVPPSHPDNKVAQARRFRDRMPGRVWHSDQYDNPDNALAHHSTASEIFTERPDIGGFASAVGTGGTLLGVQQWCQAHRPDVRLARVINEPESRAEGIGGTMPSRLIEQLQEDCCFWVTDRQAFRWMDEYQCGPSAAINIEGAIRLARLFQISVATVICDHRDRYPHIKTQ